MLKDILKTIQKDGYISRTKLARQLGLSEAMINDGIKELVRMGYLEEEKTGENCPTICAKCPFAKNCNKEIVKTFKIADLNLQ